MARAELVAALAGLSGVLSCVGTRLLIPLLRRRDVLDRPNQRSSHDTPTPRGGGIAVIGAIVLAWTALNRGAGFAPAGLVIPLAAILLAIVSWLDDLRGLAPGWRLAAQIPMVALGLLVLPPEGRVFQGWLAPPLDLAVAGLVWLWFVNLYNFMDGLDGLVGSETAAITAGLLLFGTVGAGRATDAAPLAALIGAAAVGFLVWNWAPARIFLGDVGSVPLGYILGFVLLELAARGWWKIASILPLYFLADATITLAVRLLRREKIWRPHRDHFYQRAARGGLNHAEVVTRVIALDIALIGCGWAAENGGGLTALAAALALVGVFLRSLAAERPARR